MGVIVVASCTLLLVIGMGLTIRWSREVLAPPPGGLGHGVGDALLHVLWWAALGSSAGLASGILVVGAGGRLAMRLLAATSEEARGRITEADQVVGAITLEGTIGFIVFIGVFGGVLTGLGYVAIQRWLPGGPATGLYYGLVLLVAFGTRLEPLRADNEDFDLVGPAWLSLLTFVCLGLLHGAAISAFVRRWSRTQPLLTSVRAIPRYLALIPVIAFVPTALAMVLTVVIVISWQWLGTRVRWQDHWTTVGGRVLLVAVLVAATPGFLSSMADIAGRGP